MILEVGRVCSVDWNSSVGAIKGLRSQKSMFSLPRFVQTGKQPILAHCPPPLKTHCTHQNTYGIDERDGNGLYNPHGLICG